MKTRNKLVATVLASIAMAATAAVHAQSNVLGDVYSLNPGTTATTLYQTYQTGSSTSDSMTWSNASCGACLGIEASGAGNVTNGSLGASVAATFPASLPVSSSAAFEASTTSLYKDSLTITGGTGRGVLALAYTVDGSLATSGLRGANLVEASVISSQAGGTVLAPGGTTLISSTTSLGPLALTGDTGYLGAFKLVGGSQSGTVMVDLPFNYGSAFLIAPDIGAITEANAITPLPYSSDVNFDDTMTLDSALVYAGTPSDLGAENYSADISAASGLSYGSSGVTAAPEIDPSLTLSGLTLLGGVLLVLRGRRRIGFAG